MKIIEIRIPELGKAIGTTNWVAEKLEHISKTLTVSKTRDNEPCLVYEHWNDKQGNETPKKYVLCFISNEIHSNYGYDNKYKNVMCVYSHQVNPEFTYLFKVLSIKAEEIVNDFLYEICMKFYEEYNIS